MEALGLATSTLLRTHASAAAAAAAHKVDERTVYSAMSRPEVGLIGGVVLQWAQHSEDGEWVGSRSLTSSQGPERARRRSGRAEVRAAPSTLDVLQDCLPAVRRLCAPDMPRRCV